MRERGILFSAPMVRAILAGTKTQTRRALRDGTWLDPELGVIRMCSVGPGVTGYQEVACPYGAPGDRLWVREAWRSTGDDGRCDDMPPRDMQAHQVWYEADGKAPADELVGKLRPGMFMPRWASRITLEVVSVRVELLQDISEADAIAEGYSLGAPPCIDDPLGWYRRLWESINGKWEPETWVWVVHFRRL